MTVGFSREEAQEDGVSEAGVSEAGVSEGGVSESFFAPVFRLFAAKAPPRRIPSRVRRVARV